MGLVWVWVGLRPIDLIISKGIKLTHTMAVTSSLKKKEINGRLVFFIGPKSNHCLPLELTNSQTDSCC